MTAKKSKAKSPGKPGLSCDYCGVALPPRHAATIFGLFACDRCLLANTDEANDEFEAAVRWKRGIKLSYIESMLRKCSDPDLAERVADVREKLEHSRSLYWDGEVVAAMEAAQVAWYASSVLHAIVELSPLASTGFKAKQQRTRAGFSSGEERAAARRQEWSMWQASADEVAKHNPSLSDSRIHEIVASQFGRTRQAISKRVKVHR